MRTADTENKKKRRKRGKADEEVKKEKKYEHKKKSRYKTYEGYDLTVREAKFIDHYIASGNQRESVIEAGYKLKAPGQYAQVLMRKSYIAHEIEHRMELEREKKVASGQEVMEFFASVMRGDVKDQFGLDAPLSERIKAGQEIAKRTVDIANKVAGVKANGENEVTIKLDWSRKMGG